MPVVDSPRRDSFTTRATENDDEDVVGGTSVTQVRAGKSYARFIGGYVRAKKKTNERRVYVIHQREIVYS